jgi:hypothetical protein
MRVSSEGMPYIVQSYSEATKTMARTDDLMQELLGNTVRHMANLI